MFFFSPVTVGAVTTAQSQAEYKVELTTKLSHFKVSYCFSAQAPSKLVNLHPDAEKHLQWIKLITNDKTYELEPKHGRVAIPAGVDSGCVHYAINLRGQTTHPWYRKRQSHQDQALVEVRRWLWRPQPAPDDDVLITLQKPPGFRVSAPWSLVSREETRTQFRIAKRPRDWDARIAFGKFQIRDTRIGNAQVRVAMLNGKTPLDAKMVMQWIDHNLRALTLAYGEFPLSSIQLLVVPVGADTEPVPWGQVLRGGGDAVHVYIDQTRSAAEFHADWVLIHELSHLLHPRLHSRDAWLYEGLASYYQNVLRVRAGMLPAQTGWQKLHRGFERGRNAGARTYSLVSESENMMRNKNFMRVYWSGAAIFLLADARLREQSGGQVTLDTTLQKFERCCLPTSRWWEGKELMAKFDQLSNSKIFSDLYAQYVLSANFPELDGTYSLLGIQIKDSRVVLADVAPHKEIRDAIMSPVAAAPQL